MKLRDLCWLWGHPEGCYNNAYGNTQASRMTPMECCIYLGIRNTFMVPDGEHTNYTVNRRQYNKSFSSLKEVGWECFDASKDADFVKPIIEEAANFPNIGRVVFDDFYFQYKNMPGSFDMANVEKARKLLKENDVRPLDMWMVIYTKEFGLNQEDDNLFREWLSPFDGGIMWTWEEKDVPLIPEKFEHFKNILGDKKKMFGCYLWNFGEAKPATRDAVLWQLDWYLEKIKAGEAEGIVFHTNTMADLDLEAYDAAVEWMQIHGDDEV